MAKPSDHPDFFRLPAPEGRSRESSIVLDAEGRFFHDGALITHPGMQQAFSRWIARHPDDGRYVLHNGYDWTYFRVEDAPFQIVAVRPTQAGLELELSDGSREPLDAERLSCPSGDALYVSVKQGQFLARFSRSAQLALAPYLEQDASGRLFIDFGGRRAAIPLDLQKA